MLRLSRLYVQLEAALLEARSTNDSPASTQESCDQPVPVDNPTELRRNVAEFRRFMAKIQEICTSCPAHILSTRDILTFLCLGVDKISGQDYCFPRWNRHIQPNRSQESADEMSDVWEHSMTHSIVCPEATAACFPGPPHRNE